MFNPPHENVHSHVIGSLLVVFAVVFFVLMEFINKYIVESLFSVVSFRRYSCTAEDPISICHFVFCCLVLNIKEIVVLVANETTPFNDGEAIIQPSTLTKLHVYNIASYKRPRMTYLHKTIQTIISTTWFIHKTISEKQNKISIQQQTTTNSWLGTGTCLISASLMEKLYII